MWRPYEQMSSDLKHFLKVRFNNSDSTYDYICDDLDVSIGDRALVPPKYGPKEAIAGRNLTLRSTLL